MKTIRLVIFIIIVSLVACSNQDNNNHPGNEDIKSLSFEPSIQSTTKVVNLNMLINVVTNYHNSQSLLQNHNFVKHKNQRDYGNNCNSDIYQIYNNGLKIKDSPYLEYVDCITEVKSLSLDGSGTYLAVIRNLIDEAVSQGFKEIYSESYDDGSFEKEFSKDDIDISYLQEIMDDGNFVQTFHLLY